MFWSRKPQEPAGRPPTPQPTDAFDRHVYERIQAIPGITKQEKELLYVTWDRRKEI